MTQKRLEGDTQARSEFDKQINRIMMSIRAKTAGSPVGRTYLHTQPHRRARCRLWVASCAVLFSPHSAARRTTFQPGLRLLPVCTLRAGRWPHWQAPKQPGESMPVAGAAEGWCLAPLGLGGSGAP